MPQIEFDLEKGPRNRLSGLYAQIKELKARKGTIEKEIERTKSEIASFSPAPPHRQKASSQKKKKTKWHEGYLHFTTSSGNLVVAGRNAKQNDELVAKHLTENDLFFHADIQGAPATILAGGKKALEAAKSGDGPASLSLKETAQWAASYSSAWKTGASSVDVYALFSHQVSKHAPEGGSVGKGAFALTGEREWFRATPLGLKIGVENGAPCALPAIHPKQLAKQALLFVGKSEKQEASKELSSHLSFPMEEIAPWLPSGKFSIKK